MTIAECDYWFHRGRAAGMREIAHALDRSATSYKGETAIALFEAAGAARDASIDAGHTCTNLVHSEIASRGMP